MQTTRSDETAEASADLVQRQYSAARPKKLSIADFTCVATWRGFVYVAFVIVGFVRRIVGGRAYTAMRTKLVLDALEQALHDRELDGQLIIRIAARKTSRCGTRTACWRPARRPGSGASATPTIMRSSSR